MIGTLLFVSSMNAEIRKGLRVLLARFALAILVSLVPISVGIAQTADAAGEFTDTVGPVAPRVLFDIEVELAGVRDTNLNLDTQVDEDATALEVKMELGITYLPSKRLLAYSNLTVSRELDIEDQEDNRDYQSTLEVDEAYIDLSNLLEVEDVLKKTSLRIGRQKISDSREWLYDESVDGVLFDAKLDPLDVSIRVSLNREEVFGSNLLGHTDRDRINNLILISEYDSFKDFDLRLGVHAIARDDRSADDDSPRFLALRALGSVLDKRLNYWADVAWVRGDNGDKPIKGQGLDVGTTASFGSNGTFYMTVGYAFGSGSGDTDSDFRQTGLHGNSDRFGGISSFKYYGELLDPELSNMHITTFGLGYRFSADSSVDLIYHRYQQDQLLDELRNSDLDEDPDGVHKQLGEELDVVWGINHTSGLESEFTLGYFRPGHAFSESADDAFIARAKFTYEF